MFETTIKVKQETRKKLKLYAAEHGITMDEAINKLLPQPTIYLESGHRLLQERL